MQPSTLAKRGTLLLFLLIIAFYLVGLGHLPLLGPDEPRYAQIAREMLARGDVITPTLGGHLWFEKPALLYWMMMISYEIFGVSEWSARLPSAVCGVLIVGAVYYVASRVERASANLSNNFALHATFIAATTLGVIVFARAATFDIVLTMTIGWALALFFASELETDRRRQLLLAGFYVFAGLSLLAKGFLGLIIPAGVVGTYFLMLRQWPGKQTFASCLWGLPLALLVAAAWYGPITLRHGWLFIDQFIVEHQFSRYISNDYRHPGPFYYYLGILPMLTAPWILFAVQAIGQSRVWRRDPNALTPMSRLTAFACAWILFPLVFFSFARAKLPAYILPAVPAVILLAAKQLLRSSRNLGWALIGTAALLLVGATVIVVYQSRSADVSLGAASLLATILAVGCLIALLSRKSTVVTAALGLTTSVVAIVALFLASHTPAERDSSKRLLEIASERGYSQTRIFGLRPDDRSPEFYAPDRVTYEANGEPVIYIGPPPITIECQRTRETLLAFVLPRDVVELRTSVHLTTDVIGTNGRYFLVAVTPK